MKILHIDFTGPFTEKMSYQENLIPKYHAIDGHEVVFLATCYEWDNNSHICYTPPTDKIMNNGVRLIRLNYKKIVNKSITFTVRKVNGVYNLIKQLLPDLIFFHCPQTIELLTIVRYAKKNPNVHIFVDNHADYINSGHNWLSRNILHKIIWRYCAKSIEPYTTKFYGVTPARCNFLINMYRIPVHKIELLVMGADDEKIHFAHKSRIRQNIRNALKISKNDFVIVTGGKIDESKNIHLLMQAVISMSRSNLKLLIFGSPNQSMKQTIDNLSKSDCIRNIGWIASDEVYDYFLSSDLAVFPGTHSVLWEQSVGTGIPGVFKYWQGMDHIDLGGNCKFLHTDNAEEIKKLIDEILNDNNEYQMMKKVAEDIGIKKFSYREISRQAIKLLKGV